MAVTAALIKELRGMTGVGMRDCKAALVETDGDIEKAVEVLRKKGIAKAEKKAGRVAAEGLSFTYISEDGKAAAAVEVNSETDFVAKNEIFRTFVENVAKQAVKSDAADMDELNLAAHLTDGEKIVVGNINDKVDKTEDLEENINKDESIPVNINTADAAELETLEDIGPSLAENIIEYRNRYGSFTSIEEIREVDGIGEATFNKIKDSITIN